MAIEGVKSSEFLWDNLYDAIKELTDKDEPIHAALETSSIEDRVETTQVVAEDSVPKEAPSYPLDKFLLYVSAGKRPHNFLSPVGIGSGKRVFNPDNNGFKYSRETIKMLRHEAGLRLERLCALGRELYFSSKILGYANEPVNEQLIKEFVIPGVKGLGLVS